MIFLLNILWLLVLSMASVPTELVMFGTLFSAIGSLIFVTMCCGEEGLA